MAPRRKKLDECRAEFLASHHGMADYLAPRRRMPACPGEERVMTNVLSSAIAAGGPLGVIASMITPAFLILSAANLINSALARLARAVDRARAVGTELRAARAAGDSKRIAALQAAIKKYGGRGSLMQLALAAFYLAIGCFVATSIAIAITHVAHNSTLWLPAWLTIAGAVLLFIGTVVLFAENRIATRMLREEIADVLEGA
jgi:hypothetical protein